MSALVLTVASTITCQHSGMAQLTTSNTKLDVAGAKALLESDVHLVTGCPFMVGQKYSPCVRIEWSAGSQKLTVSGTAALIQTSIGKCYSAEGAVQGVANKVAGQDKVMA
jgi:hypothetical protein